MHPARIAELLEPFLLPANNQRLTTNDLERISTYIDIIQRWNARINLTAIRDPEQIVTRHFGESLFAARHLFPRIASVGPGLRPGHGERSSPASAAEAVTTPTEHPGRASLQNLPRVRRESSAESPKEDRVSGTFAKDPSEPALPLAEAPSAIEGKAKGKAKGLGTNDRLSLADLGSGAGFPGIPIKLWAPQISLTLIESNHKKATFLREVARALTLTDINIQTTRAQDLVKQSQLKQDATKQNQKKEAHQDVSPLFHVVTLRAVERFPEVLPLAAALVSPGGRLALLIGCSQQPAVMPLPEFQWLPSIPIPLSKSRILLIGTRTKKVTSGPTAA